MPSIPTKDAVITKLMAEVFPKRIRPIEFFKDYDPLRKCQVTESQFTRSLKQLMPTLSPQEWETLIAAYRLENGMVNYKEMCTEVDKVFVTTNLDKKPLAEPTPAGQQIAHLKDTLDLSADMHMQAILHRVALLAGTRGVVMKYCFEDADRGDSTSLTVPRRAGKVTEAQFRRNFPLQKDFTDAEIGKLVERYREPDQSVNYKALHDEITDKTKDIVQDAPIPTSHYITPEHILADEWSRDDYSILERVTAKVLEKKVRLNDYFQDFDNLRKGWCTVGQLDTVFGILGLKFSPPEMEQLKQKYFKRDLNLEKFNYAAFCAEVNSVMTYDMIHTDPLARICLPSADATMPCRRSKLHLTEKERVQIADIERDIRQRVSKRRILFINAFKDFDTTCQGHVTVAQFARVMQTLGLNGGQQDETQSELLAKKYCDLGNRIYFNYREFCAVCDPPSPDVVLGEKQSQAPYEKPAASRYFNPIGQVFDVTDGRFK